MFVLDITRLLYISFMDSQSFKIFGFWGRLRDGGDREVLKQLGVTVGPMRWHIVLLTAIEVVLGAAVVVFAWILRGLVDAAVGHDASMFGTYAGAAVALTVLQLALRAVSRRELEFTRSGLENSLKTRLLTALLERDYSSVSTIHSGEWLNRLTSDTSVVADAVATIIPSLCGMLVKLLGAIGLMIYLAPALALVLIPAGLIMIAFTAAFRRKLKSMHKDIQEADGSLRVYLSERLSSMRIVRAFVAQRTVKAESSRLMDAHRAARMRRNTFSNWCNIAFGICMRGAYVLGAIWCGWQILIGAMTYGTFVAVIQLVSQIQSPFANLSGFVPRYFAMIASAERLMQPESYAPPAADMLADAQVRELYDTSFKAIELAHIDFSYFEDNQNNAEGGVEGTCELI
jgi:ATP-binding cassette subfamily B protein